jgi:hypothetical protein
MMNPLAIIPCLKHLFTCAFFFIALSFSLSKGAAAQRLGHDVLTAQAQKSCASLQGRKLSLVLTVNPVSGFDLAAKVVMHLKAHAHPHFPNNPYLARSGGLIDLQTEKLPPKERQQMMGRGQIAVHLSDQVTTLLTSSQFKPPMQACLHAATQAALLFRELSDLAQRPKLVIQPADMITAKSKLSLIDQALRQHGPYFQNLVSP